MDGGDAKCGPSGSVSMNVDPDESDPMTALSLAPPGLGGCGSPERRGESAPAGFWDVMRNVIAREVRDFVTTSFQEASGFQ